jgi:hypothetical protein
MHTIGLRPSHPSVLALTGAATQWTLNTSCVLSRLLTRSGHASLLLSALRQYPSRSQAILGGGRVRPRVGDRRPTEHVPPGRATNFLLQTRVRQALGPNGDASWQSSPSRANHRTYSTTQTSALLCSQLDPFVEKAHSLVVCICR